MQAEWVSLSVGYSFMVLYLGGEHQRGSTGWLASQIHALSHLTVCRRAREKGVSPSLPWSLPPSLYVLYRKPGFIDALAQITQCELQ